MNLKHLRYGFENVTGTSCFEHSSQRNDKGRYKNLTLRRKWKDWFDCAVYCGILDIPSMGLKGEEKWEEFMNS